jgi:hypothetical protein
MLDFSTALSNEEFDVTNGIENRTNLSARNILITKVFIQEHCQVYS